MPSYLIDEGGERTHAVIPVEEYERLRSAFETLATVRGYAHEMVAALDTPETHEVVESQVAPDSPNPSPWNPDQSRQGSDWSR